MRSADVPAITGGGSQLMVSGVLSDKVDLLGSLTEARGLFNGTTYRTFASGGVTVLVEQGLTVAVGGPAPAGAIGLKRRDFGRCGTDPWHCCRSRLYAERPLLIRL